MNSSIENLASLVHREILLNILESGRAPSNSSLSKSTGHEVSEVRLALQWLESTRGLVLHSGTDDVWVIPPLSLVPTAVWVKGEQRGWWAACIWCALGVCSIAKDSNFRIHVRLGGESESVVVDVSNNVVEPKELIVHFPTPIAQAWDNVHRYCAATLPFRSESEVDLWCNNHGTERGDIQSLETVNQLAIAWYGNYLDPAWKKWNASEAKQIFDSLGLTSSTWSI